MISIGLVSLVIVVFFPFLSFLRVNRSSSFFFFFKVREGSRNFSTCYPLPRPYPTSFVPLGWYSSDYLCTSSVSCSPSKSPGAICYDFFVTSCGINHASSLDSRASDVFVLTVLPIARPRCDLYQRMSR